MNMIARVLMAILKWQRYKKYKGIFKQIIGRGTRINEEFGKSFFTIMDFRNVTDLFADPDFDGDPVRVKDFGGDEEIDSPEDEIETDDPILDDDD